MPDTLRLDDLHLELALSQHIDREIALGRYDLTQGRKITISGNGGEPGTSSLVDGLKAKLGKYIDFDAGGLKLLEIDVRGRPAHFTLVPGWDSGPETGTKSHGGPSITLQFSMHF